MDKSELLEKHRIVLEAAKKYWVDNIPTGLTDEEFDILEKNAIADGINPRDIVLSSVSGNRDKNADYITQVPKEQVPGSMYDKLSEIINEDNFIIPKYDGSSIAVYYENGRCTKILTAGGENRGGLGVIQTDKLRKWVPDTIDSRVKCIQCEFLVDLKYGFGDKSRMKSNGLITSKSMQSDVDLYGTMRAFRIFGDKIDSDYWKILTSLPRVYNESGDLKFSPGLVVSKSDLHSYYGSDFFNKDILELTRDSDPEKLLIDGWVEYSRSGEVKKAYKFKTAGRGELSTIKRMLWNNQSSKGKDGWSLNVELDPPVVVRGASIRKPSSGGVPRAIRENMTPGASVTIILSNSTIPKVDKVIVPGNGDMQYPTCSCGYKMNENDIFGSNLKCGNKMCTERIDRMRKLVESSPSFIDIDLNNLLVIDRFDFTKKLSEEDSIDLKRTLYNAKSPEEIKGLLVRSIKPSSLQSRMIDLVVGPLFYVLNEFRNNTEN